MGICQSHTYIDEQVPYDDNFWRGIPTAGGGGAVHMLIIAINYEGTYLPPLKATKDGDMMRELASICGITDVETLYETSATMDAVRSAVCRVASRTGREDYFILYFSGHGGSIPDDDGEEEDGRDECIVTYPFSPSQPHYYRDDDVCEDITSNVQWGSRVLIVADCCHSGTIADFDSRPHAWRGIEAISISGCEDHDVSVDTGRGGVLTLSMLLAIQALQKTEDSPYSVGKLFNQTLEEDGTVFSSSQSLQLATHGVSPDRMASPFFPLSHYSAPSSRAGLAARSKNPINTLAALGF